MELQTLGPWILFGTGIVLLLAAVGVLLFRKEARSVWGLLIFGLATAGTGLYGPTFLEDYSGFIEQLAKLQSAAELDPTDPDDQMEALATYSEFFEQVGSGALPEEIASAGLAMTLARPLPGMEEELQAAIGRTSHAEGRVLLERTEGELRGRKAVAEELRAHEPDGADPLPESALEFDTSTRRLLVDPALFRPDAVRPMPELERDRLREFVRPQGLRRPR